MVRVKEDLTGKTFGRLTVIKQVEDYVDPLGGRKAQYLCECNCEDRTQVVVTAARLKSGGTKSCGCILKEINKSRKEDLRGQKFNRLTVIDYADDYIGPDGKHHTAYLCECDCAAHSRIVVRGTNLKSGDVKSCGCLKLENITKTHKKPFPH